MQVIDRNKKKVSGWEALRQPAYRNYTLGSAVSWTGDWLDLTALNWAVLEMSGSPIDLGIINACRTLPVFFLSYPAGALADLYDRRRLIFRLQAVVMVLTVIVGLLIQQGTTFWMFALVVFIRAICNAMVIPIRNSFASNLVPKELIGSGTAVQSTIMNLARILGPALAGWLLSIWATPYIFYLNALSFVFVLYTLVRLEGMSNQRPIGKKLSRKVFSEVFGYLMSHPSLKALLALSVFPMVFGFPYTTMMPLFVRDVFLGGPETLGLLLSVAAVGALVGAWGAAKFSSLPNQGAWMLAMIGVFGGSLCGLSVSRNSLWIFAMMFLVGLSGQLYRTLNRMAFQVAVPDEMRGRVLSIALMDRGFIPVGSLLIGVVAQYYGASASLVFMGGACLLVALGVLFLSPSLRRMSFSEIADAP